MEMLKKKVGSVVATATLLFCAAPLSAGAGPSGIERARRHMELGQEAFHQYRFDEAAVHFDDAFAASPFAAFLYNAGLAMERAGNHTRAVAYYRKYLEKEPDAGDADDIRAKLEALSALPASAAEAGPDAPPLPLAGASGETVEIEAPPPGPAPAVEIAETAMKSLISVRTNPKDATVRIISEAGALVSTSTGPLAQTVEGGTYTIEASHPDYKTVSTDIFVAAGQVYVIVVEMSQGAFLGFLRVITEPPGAAVYIDDKALGQVGITPFSSVVPTGRHLVRVEKPGYLPEEKEIHVDVSEEVEYNAPLRRPAVGRLLVKANVNGAVVHVDGIPVGTADIDTPFRKEMPAGTYTVTLTRDGLKDYSENVVVRGGRESKLLVRLNAKPRRTSGWVSAGFAAALFGAGGVLGYFALDLRNELDGDRKAGRLASNDDRIVRGFLWGIGADLSFGVGTVIACMSLYYFLRDPLPPSEGKQQEAVDYPIGIGTGFEPSGASHSGRRESRSSPPSGARRRFLVAPLIGTESAGVGLAVSF